MTTAAARLGGRAGAGLACVAAVVAALSCRERTPHAQLVRVSRAYMVIPAGTSPSAMYFTVDNDGVWADTLVAVNTPAAASAELHETAPVARATVDAARPDDRGAHAIGSDTGAPRPATKMMTMVPLTLVVIPAHSVVRFAPGGRHVMLLSPRAGLGRGDSVSVVFIFARRGEIRRRAAVITYADVDTATAAPPPANP